MKINLIAQLKNYREFIDNFKPDDEFKNFDGKPLIFYSLANTNEDERNNISNFLLDKQAKVTGVDSEGYNALQVLLSYDSDNIIELANLCQRLIEMGVNINHTDINGQVPFDYILRMKHSDKKLMPLYNLFLGQNNLDLSIKDNTNTTPLDHANSFPFRAEIAERMKEYAKR